jgi:hypothetical protein
MVYTASLGSALPQSKQTYIDAMKATSQVLGDRIYIHDELSERNIQIRFLELMNHFRDAGSDFDGPGEEANALLSEVITMARKG